MYDYTLSKDKAVLKLAEAIPSGASLTVTYNKPTGANETVLEDLAGNDLAKITAHAVTNSTVDVIVLNKTSLTVAEGGTGSFTVKLSSQPAGDVAVAVYIKDSPAPARMSDNVLDFTTTTWQTAQTVTVTGRTDANDWDDTATISLKASRGALLEEPLGKASVALTVTDTSSRNALEFTPDGLLIAEGSSARLTVRLTKKPSGNVRVSLARPESADGLSVSPAMLVFTPSSYSAKQFFTLHAEQDADTDDEMFGVNLKATGGDYDYRGPGIRVRTTDTGSSRVLVMDPPVLLTVPEGGSATATVKLSTAPTGNVTVSAVMGTEPTHGLTVSPSSLTFTTSDYANPKTLTFSAAQDAGAVDERAVATLTASGGGYANKSMRFEVVSHDDELHAHEQKPTATITALDSGDADFSTEGKIPKNGKIKVSFSKAVGTCSLRTAAVCPTDVTAWTTIDSSTAEKLFALVRVGLLDTDATPPETREIPFTVSVSGNDVTLTPGGPQGDHLRGRAEAHTAAGARQVLER